MPVDNSQTPKEPCSLQKAIQRTSDKFFAVPVNGSRIQMRSRFSWALQTIPPLPTEADISFEALSLQNFPMFYRELSLCTFHAVACHFDSLADQFQRQQRVPNML